jgi:hypothetical protein
MDEGRFDTLTRSLAHMTSRRRTVGVLAGAVVGAILPVGALPGAAQSTDCTSAARFARCGGCGDCVPTGWRRSWFGLGREILSCKPNHAFCVGPDSSADSCPSCDARTLTCTHPRPCGPCQECFSNTSCQYLSTGREDQCPDPDRPCIPATGKCGCGDPLTYCEPDCVDTKTDRNHCGACRRKCSRCQKCQDGRCVPCDRQCESCTSGGDCESKCKGPCKTVCQNGKCVEPYPPICVCEAEGEDGPPNAKRILPVVAAQGTDRSRVEPCGEGDNQQCCVPEACCQTDRSGGFSCCAPGETCAMPTAGMEGPYVYCPPELACGALCCNTAGEQCVLPCCVASNEEMCWTGPQPARLA